MPIIRGPFSIRKGSVTKLPIIAVKLFDEKAESKPKRCRPLVDMHFLWIFEY
jgi:hypothetical protein